MGTVSPTIYELKRKELAEQAEAENQKAADTQPGKLVNMKMHVIVAPQGTFEALANELFGFPSQGRDQ